MISENKQRTVYVVGDWLATSLAWFIFTYIRFLTVDETYIGTSFENFLTIRPVILGQFVFPVGMLIIYWFSGYYNKVFLKSRIEELTTTLTTAIIGTVLIYFAAIVDDPIPDRATNYELLLMLFALLFGIVYVERLILTTINNRRIARGTISFNALIIGSLTDSLKMKNRLAGMHNHMSHALNVVGISEWDKPSDSTHDDEPLPIVERSKVAEFCKENNVKALILATYDGDAERLLTLINSLLPLELPIMLSPTLVNVLTSKPRISRLVADPLIDITSPNISESTINMKRFGDFVVSVIAAIVLIPVYVAIAMAIKLDSKGPIFYTQKRIGLHRKPFRIIKFRTMIPNAEPSGPMLSSEIDPRTTKVGRFLRKYRLDELPQFFNVIMGQMSLVGPRPERNFYIQQILKTAPYYTLLHCVRPGITSLGMVKHGYASNVEEMIQRMHYDLIYIENVSLTTDLKILAYTIATVMSGKGK